MFHGNLVHGSAPNITPYPRKIIYRTLSAVSNHIRKPTRPEWIPHRYYDLRHETGTRGRRVGGDGAERDDPRLRVHPLEQRGLREREGPRTAS